MTPNDQNQGPAREVARRLDSIEHRLHDLTEVVVVLARVEERVGHLIAAADRNSTRTASVEKRVADLERRGEFVRVVERVVWLAIAAGVALLVPRMLAPPAAASSPPAAAVEH